MNGHWRYLPHKVLKTINLFPCLMLLVKIRKSKENIRFSISLQMVVMMMIMMMMVMTILRNIRNLEDPASRLNLLPVTIRETR